MAAVGLVLVALAALPASSQPSVEIPADRVKVSMTELEPFLVRDGELADGFYAEIWDRVAARLGVEYDIVWVDTFGELLPTLEDGDAQVAVAPLAPTAEREVRYDFSSAVILSGPQLGYHERIEQRASLFLALLSGPVLRVLLAAVAALLVLAHLIWWAERGKHGEDGDFHDGYLQGIWDGFWWATVTVTTVGYGDKSPKSVRGRAIALVAMLTSLILVGAFVSQVTAILQESRETAPFTTLAEVGERPVGVVAGTSFAAFVEGSGATAQTYDTQDAVFEAAAAGEVDAVVANPFALDEIGPRFGLVAVGEVMYEEFETFGLEQGSPWREPINQVLADMQASGEIQEIVDRWLN